MEVKYGIMMGMFEFNYDSFEKIYDIDIDIEIV